MRAPGLRAVAKFLVAGQKSMVYHPVQSLTSSSLAPGNERAALVGEV